MTTATAASPLTPALIESVISSMPVQGQIVLRLLLLQHFDLTEEEIRYMAADRPDPRCVAGSKPTHNVLTQEAVKAVRDKYDYYLRYARMRRERTWLQCECTAKLLQLRLATADRAVYLLATRYGVTPETIESLRAQARTAVNKPQIRALDQRWEASEISAEDYQRQRLGIELQTQLRLVDRYSKRLDHVKRERVTADNTPLLDYEIELIWGIPTGSLAARKTKYLSQYLQALHAALHNGRPGAEALTAPIDLWKESFTVLSSRPIQRSVPPYDGLEKTEAKLNDKLTTLAWSTLPEEMETKFWISLVHGASSNAMHPELTRNLFGLQRLAAILNDLDTSTEAIDEFLLTRTAPKAKEQPAELLEPKPEESAEANQMQDHVLKSMMGEQHPDLYGGGKW